MMGGGGMEGMMGEMHGGGGMSMGACPMCKMMVGDEVHAACMVDLEKLGLAAETRKALEDARFELKKTVIRKMADVQVLKLELHRMVAEQGFDLEAARKKAKAMAEIEAELHAAHLGLLHELASKLTAEQWQKLQEQKQHTMKEMMGGMSGKEGDGKEGMMQGGMMQGGHMMMESKGQKGSGRHHGDSSKEAERFFKDD
jgi:Spy/CpxP family protein refolding chaperone